ncbi:MAG: hypothetical protein LBK61_11415 [Spirochaetaceae bacterium]|jgi:hypothetical protein|nr:hypothetical protein [Spirochaetaceae bacterium]
MKTIIGIWNYPGDKEVKATIREVARLLLKKYPFADILEPSEIAKEIKIIPDEGDFRLRFRIKNVEAGIDSSIHSYSKEAAPDFPDCQLIICATAYRGKTTDGLESLAENASFRLVWTTPYVSEAETNQQFQDHLNNLKAQHILDMIGQLGVLN